MKFNIFVTLSILWLLGYCRSAAEAQNHQFSIYTTPNILINKLSIRENENAPGKVLAPTNLNINFGVQYTYVTKKGLLLGANIHGGTNKQVAGFRYDLNQVPLLNNPLIMEHRLEHHRWITGLDLSIGKEYKIKGNSSVQIKGGIGLILGIGRTHKQYNLITYVIYEQSPTNTNVDEVASASGDMGNFEQRSFLYFDNVPLHFYTGYRFKSLILPKKFPKMYLGLHLTYAPLGSQNNIQYSFRSYENNEVKFVRSSFANHWPSVGLKIGLEL